MKRPTPAVVFLLAASYLEFYLMAMQYALTTSVNMSTKQPVFRLCYGVDPKTATKEPKYWRLQSFGTRGKNFEGGRMPRYDDKL